MRLVKQNIDAKDGSGSATLLPEEPEDMWHAFNLIQNGDLLRASAVRKIITESDTGSRSNERVHMKLTIRVTKLDFDPQAGQLHVAGQVAEENKFVKLGSFHTLDLELQRAFTLEKTIDDGVGTGWDSVAQAQLREAIDPAARAQLWAVVMQPGLANICLITEHQTILRQRVEMSLPKKRAGSSDHETKLAKFFETTLDSLLRQIDSAEPPPLLLASPGFTAANFQQFIKTQAAAGGSNRGLQKLVPQITVAHAASAHLHSLAEVLRSPAVTSRLSDSKFARETALMERFLTMVRQDDRKAWYGPRECEAAVERGAVGKGGGVLLISNALFRSQDVATRKRWVAVVDAVNEQGGEVRVLSSMHESGKRLDGLGGIAAILTYAIDDLDEELEGEGGDGVS